MASFQIREGSLSPFLKNITIDLSSTSGIMFFFVLEPLDVFPEGLSLPLDNAG
jgi:hypothetical protein